MKSPTDFRFDLGHSHLKPATLEVAIARPLGERVLCSS
jgi:hypothetical protein